MVEMVEKLVGRLGKSSVERVRYVINNLLHLVIVKYGVISLVLCISTRLRLVTIPSPLVKYLVIFHADPCNKSYISQAFKDMIGGGSLRSPDYKWSLNVCHRPSTLTSHTDDLYSEGGLIDACTVPCKASVLSGVLYQLSVHYDERSCGRLQVTPLIIQYLNTSNKSSCSSHS